MGSNLQLVVAALQLDARPGPTADNIERAEQLLVAEAERLGIGEGGRHLDLLLLPELAFLHYDLDPATSWLSAEGLQGGGAKSPSLQALSRWAQRWRCYVGATVLEAHSDGHIYNTFVMADPSGGLIAHMPGSGGANGASVLRKSRAASMEAYVFADGSPQRVNPASRTLRLPLAPLVAKRQASGVSGGTAAGGSDAAASPQAAAAGAGVGIAGAAGVLTVGVAVCYENLLASCMTGLQEADEKLDLLLAPFCAMRPDESHRLYGMRRTEADWFEALPRVCVERHALALHTHVVHVNHTGAWRSALPPLMPGAPAPPPFSSSFAGRSAIIAPDGTPLAEAPRDGEALIVAALPLPLEGASPARPAAAAAGAAPTIPSGQYRRCFADQLDLGPGVPATVRYGFPLVEALGKLSYWTHRQWRRAIARSIARAGVWEGPREPWGGGGAASSDRHAGATAALGAVVLAAAAVAGAALAVRSARR